MKEFAYVFPINSTLHWSKETPESLVARCMGTGYYEEVIDFADHAEVGSFITLDNHAFVSRSR